MGLAIARGIVEAHGGRIWIEDGANKVGSRFVFRLPTGDDEQPIKSLESESLESEVKG